MSTNWLAERERLVYELGALLAPVLEAVSDTSAEKACVMARFAHDRELFQTRLLRFCKRPGHNFQQVFNQVYRRLHLIHESSSGNESKEALEMHRDALIRVISAVPVDVPSEDLEAHSPFSAYCTILDRCRSACARLTIVDEYLDASIFYRYLRQCGMPSITVVTRRGIVNDTAFIQVSSLMAHERGPTRYRLVAQSAKYLHDRHFRADDSVYLLGPSFNSVAEHAYASVSLPDSSKEANQRIDSLEKSGIEIFGPSSPTHP